MGNLEELEGMKYRTVLGLWLLWFVVLLLVVVVLGRGRGSVEKPGFASPCPDADCGKTGRIEERGADAGRGREGVK